ncbi:hypothetical protein BH23THE1_BH23THE1_28730 [soil metagenome]
MDNFLINDCWFYVIQEFVRTPPNPEPYSTPDPQSQPTPEPVPEPSPEPNPGPEPYR